MSTVVVGGALANKAGSGGEAWVRLSWIRGFELLGLDVRFSREFDRFTTIATWRGPFGRIEHAGRTYGLKGHEFRKLFDLPRRSDQRFEIALDIHPAETGDLEALRANDWQLVDPHSVAGDPDAFRTYIQGSGAEFSVAQGIYSETNSGWFSDRTTRYLASAARRSSRTPASATCYPLVTAWSRSAHRKRLPPPPPTSRPATPSTVKRRRIAEEHFDSDRVLARFCEQSDIG